MQTYELTYIISSQVTSEEAGVVAKEVEAFIQSKEGVIVKSEKMAAQTLAYPIKKQSSGYFAILEFQTEQANINTIKAELEKNPKVLRHFLIVKKPIKIMKERRTRKPSTTAIPGITTKPTGPTKKVEMEDINKKLDEILA